MFNPSLLPDVATHHSADIPKPLQWVGMEDIAIPLLVLTKEGVQQQVMAKTSLYVSLDKQDAKGIHMSRLHLALNNKLAGKVIELDKLNALVQEMIQSQEGISGSARLTLEFDLVLDKPALLSGESAFQSYPVRIDAKQVDDDFHLDFELTIPYSSTCPCSASLSRQLYAEAINKHFANNIDKKELMSWVVSEAGSVATPHSQRSYAYLKLSLRKDYWPDIAAFIFQLEGVIGTPVQTAVKRQDEQEFARLNAENLMFCEDAARRMKNALEKMAFVEDYWFKMEHQESLHAHNAVVIDQKYPSA